MTEALDNWKYFFLTTWVICSILWGLAYLVGIIAIHNSEEAIKKQLGVQK